MRKRDRPDKKNRGNRTEGEKLSWKLLKKERLVGTPDTGCGRCVKDETAEEERTQNQTKKQPQRREIRKITKWCNRRKRQ